MGAATARRASGDARRDISNLEPVRLVEFDLDAERKVVAAALFPHSNLRLDAQKPDVEAALEAVLGERTNRRQRPPRALEHAEYTFEIIGNFAASRALHRHRMPTQHRQLQGLDLGFEMPPGAVELGMEHDFTKAI